MADGIEPNYPTSGELLDAFLSNASQFEWSIWAEVYYQTVWRHQMGEPDSEITRSWAWRMIKALFHKVATDLEQLEKGKVI